MTDHSAHFESIAAALAAFGVTFTPDPRLTEDQILAAMTGSLLFCITNNIETTVGSIGEDGVSYATIGWHEVAEEHGSLHSPITGCLSILTTLLHAITADRTIRAFESDPRPLSYDFAAVEAMNATAGLLYLAALHGTDVDMLSSLAEFLTDGDTTTAIRHAADRAKATLTSAIDALNAATAGDTP